MPPEYMRELLPELSKLELDIDIFYESKANLREEHLRLYKEAGIRTFQPGIESLSTPVLALMRKGTTGLQNVQLLKWAKYHGVKPVWNYLIGFPGETTGDYECQADWIQKIAHLDPPEYFGPIRFDRFSPYFDAPSEFGLGPLQSYPSYSYIYPGLSALTISNLAYFFVEQGQVPDCEFVGTFGKLDAAIQAWKVSTEVELRVLAADNDELLIADTRPASTSPLVCVTGTAAKVLELSDHVNSISVIGEVLNLTGNDLDGVLMQLLEKRLILEDQGRVLSLVLPQRDWSPPPRGFAHNVAP
jgi:ribosomal peptide maturation radical SAM protein 1